jgi:hypothetical protein
MVCIIAEMDLRPYKELMSMRKSQVDFENRLVHIPDSKTPSGEADMPMPPLPGRHSKPIARRRPARSISFPSQSEKRANPTSRP